MTGGCPRHIYSTLGHAAGAGPRFSEAPVETWYGGLGGRALQLWREIECRSMIHVDATHCLAVADACIHLQLETFSTCLMYSQCYGAMDEGIPPIWLDLTAS